MSALQILEYVIQVQLNFLHQELFSCGGPLEALVGVLVASLLGSGHCLSMCGGFALMAANAGGPSWVASSFYNLGRLLTYLMLGALVGLLGQGLNELVKNQLESAAAVLMAVCLILWGVVYLSRVLRINGVTLLSLPVPTWRGSNVLARPFRWLVQRKELVSVRSPLIFALLLGSVSTLLPCGWLYAYLLVAAGTGSVQLGVAVMFTFWLGSLPALLSLTGLVGLLKLPVGGRWLGKAPYLTGVLLILAGSVSLYQHLKALEHYPDEGAAVGGSVEHKCH